MVLFDILLILEMIKRIEVNRMFHDASFLGPILVFKALQQPLDLCGLTLFVCSLRSLEFFRRKDQDHVWWYHFQQIKQLLRYYVIVLRHFLRIFLRLNFVIKKLFGRSQNEDPMFLPTSKYFKVKKENQGRKHNFYWSIHLSTY